MQGYILAGIVVGPYTGGITIGDTHEIGVALEGHLVAVVGNQHERNEVKKIAAA